MRQRPPGGPDQQTDQGENKERQPGERGDREGWRNLAERSVQGFWNPASVSTLMEGSDWTNATNAAAACGLGASLSATIG